MKAAPLEEFAEGAARQVLAEAMDRAALRGPLWGAGFPGAVLRPRVAVAGSREAAAGPLAAIEVLAAGLAARGACIVSGGAIGTDVAAHRGALDAGGFTVIVSPTPLQRIDPDSWRPGLRDFLDCERTLFLSPFGPRHRSQRGDPIVRNRLIAALGQVAVVGQTAVRSGSNHFLGVAKALGVPRFFLDPVASTPGLTSALALLERSGATRFLEADVRSPGLVDAIIGAAHSFEKQQDRERAAQPSLFREVEGAP